MVYPVPKTGGISPLPQEIMFTRKRGLLFSFRINSILKFNCASPARQLAARASLHGKHSRTCWTLPVTSCSCRVPRPTRTEPSGRELLPPAGPRTHVQAAISSLPLSLLAHTNSKYHPHFPEAFYTFKSVLPFSTSPSRRFSTRWAVCHYYTEILKTISLSFVFMNKI